MAARLSAPVERICANKGCQRAFTTSITAARYCAPKCRTADWLAKNVKRIKPRQPKSRTEEQRREASYWREVVRNLKAQAHPEESWPHPVPMY